MPGGGNSPNPGGGLPTSYELLASDDTLFIIGNSPLSANGSELWMSDGTAAGTTDVGSLSQPILDETAVGSTLFFSSSDGRGTELWSAQLSSTPTPPPKTTPTDTATPTSTPTATSPSPAPTATAAPRSTAAPAPTPTPTPAPTIIGERAIFHRKVNKHGKPVGKAVLKGFSLEFSRPMATSVLNAADYQLEEVRAKAAGKSKLVHLRAVGLTVSYDTSSNTATINVAGKHSFPKGGVLAVNTAVASAAGKPLGGSSTFAISREVRQLGQPDGERKIHPFGEVVMSRFGRRSDLRGRADRAAQVERIRVHCRRPGTADHDVRDDGNSSGHQSAR